MHTANTCGRLTRSSDIIFKISAQTDATRSTNGRQMNAASLMKFPFHVHNSTIIANLLIFMHFPFYLCVIKMHSRKKLYFEAVTNKKK